MSVRKIEGYDAIIYREDGIENGIKEYAWANYDRYVNDTPYTALSVANKVVLSNNYIAKCIFSFPGKIILNFTPKDKETITNVIGIFDINGMIGLRLIQQIYTDFIISEKDYSIKIQYKSTVQLQHYYLNSDNNLYSDKIISACDLNYTKVDENGNIAFNYDEIIPMEFVFTVKKNKLSLACTYVNYNISRTTNKEYSNLITAISKDESIGNIKLHDRKEMVINEPTDISLFAVYDTSAPVYSKPKRTFNSKGVIDFVVDTGRNSKGEIHKKKDD